MAVDEPLVEVSTDKGRHRDPVTGGRHAAQHHRREDVTVSVGGGLGRIGAAGSPAPAAPHPSPSRNRRLNRRPSRPRNQSRNPSPSPSPGRPRALHPPARHPPPRGGTVRRRRQPLRDPLVRKLASENGIELSTVRAPVSAGVSASKMSWPRPRRKAPAAPPLPAHQRHRRQHQHQTRRGGRVAAGSSARDDAEGQSDPADHRAQDPRVAAADRAAHPDPRGRHDQDRGAAGQGEESFAEREGVNLTYLPFIARAVIDALKAHPNVNASYNEDAKEITYYDAEHLGFAVDTDQGLLSPVVHNAGDLSLGGLARAINDIAARARSGDLKPDELSGGTFTITNIGSQGALFDTPILGAAAGRDAGHRRNREAAACHLRRIRKQVDRCAVGLLPAADLPTTTAFIDGADAGRFLTTVKRRLEERSLRGRPGAVTGEPAATHRGGPAPPAIGTALVTALRAADDRWLLHRASPHRQAPTSCAGIPIATNSTRGCSKTSMPSSTSAGVSIGEKMVSAFKQSLRDSRISPTEVLARAVADAGIPVLVNASAVGFYGDTGSQIVDESRSCRCGFPASPLSRLENATLPAYDAGARVVLVRTGLVLAPSGGVLSQCVQCSPRVSVAGSGWPPVHAVDQPRGSRCVR